LWFPFQWRRPPRPMPSSRRSRGMFGFRSRCGSACGCWLQQIVDPLTGWWWTFYGKGSTGGMERPPNNPQPPENPMAEWITHRLPTADDANANGDVTTPCPPGVTSAIQGVYRCKHFSSLLAGEPWFPAFTSLTLKGANWLGTEPAPAPEHADPMEQARLERYQAKTKLIEARSRLLLAQARAIVFSPHL
jgi:hypothetical protein